MLNKLISIKNSKEKKRLGRGLGSGKGTTSGRGTKGQKSRSGYNIPRRFEGGQTPLIQRLPKRSGFKSFAGETLVLNIAKIEKNFADGDLVNLKTLKEKGLISDTKTRVKILGSENLTKKLRFQDVALTKKLLSQYREMGKKGEKVEKGIAPKNPAAKKPISKKPVSKK